MDGRGRMRLAVLAEQNFNLVDGSTVWLRNLCRMLATLPGVETTLILKEALSTRVMADDLPANIALVEPTEIGSQSRLTPDEISSALENLEGKVGRFDRIIVRGDEFLSFLLADEDWAGRVIAYSPSAKPRLGASVPKWIADARQARAPLLTQSPISKAIFETFHDYPAALVEVLPPVVHGLPVPQPEMAAGPLLVYSGKIDPGYGLEWLCDLIDMPEQERGFAITVIAGKTIAMTPFDWGAERYLRTGETLPEGALTMLRDNFDAILLGAMGDPRVPDNKHAADILLGNFGAPN